MPIIERRVDKNGFGLSWAELRSTIKEAVRELREEAKAQGYGVGSLKINIYKQYTHNEITGGMLGIPFHICLHNPTLFNIDIRIVDMLQRQRIYNITLPEHEIYEVFKDFIDRETF
jgi:hypothetical protein